MKLIINQHLWKIFIPNFQNRNVKHLYYYIRGYIPKTNFIAYPKNQPSASSCLHVAKNQMQSTKFRHLIRFTAISLLLALWTAFCFHALFDQPIQRLPTNQESDLAVWCCRLVFSDCGQSNSIFHSTFLVLHSWWILASGIGWRSAGLCVDLEQIIWLQQSFALKVSSMGILGSSRVTELECLNV